MSSTDGLATKSGSMDRVATGVTGFDKLVEGGLPKGTTILLTGYPGTGKTIFGLQYLYEGAKSGENGLYVTLDSSVELLKTQGKQFDWELEALEAAGRIGILRVSLQNMKLNLFEMIESMKKKINAQRIVFDNLATFSANIDLFTIPVGYAGNVASSVSMVLGTGGMITGRENTSNEDRVIYNGDSTERMIYLIIEKLSNLGTTNLVINYGSRDGSRISEDGVSEFICDGIVQLFNERIGNQRVRTMTVLKMRDTNHSQYIHDFEIGNKGIAIRTSGPVYK